MKYSLLLLSVLTMLVACDSEKPNANQSGTGQSGSESAQSEKSGLTITTSFYPTTWLLQEMTTGIDSIKIESPLPQGEDAIYWKPNKETIAKFQKSDLVVLNGAEFEKWPSYVVLPSSIVVSSADKFKDQWVNYETATTHKHGAGGEEHTHEGVDGHTWVDPVLFKIQAQTIFDAVKKKAQSSDHAALDQNWKALSDKLDEFDSLMKALPTKDVPLLASHPAYNYSAKRYNWKIRNLDLDPEAELTEDNFKSIEKALENHPAKIMLWESEPIASIAKVLQEKYQLKSIVFTPLENPDSLPAGTNYQSLMLGNIKRFSEALNAGTAASTAN